MEALYSGWPRRVFLVCCGIISHTMCHNCHKRSKGIPDRRNNVITRNKDDAGESRTPWQDGGVYYRFDWPLRSRPFQRRRSFIGRRLLRSRRLIFPSDSHVLPAAIKVPFRRKWHRPDEGTHASARRRRKHVTTWRIGCLNGVRCVVSMT